LLHRQYGRDVAANSLSDVYAMGGKPLSALSIVGFPDSLPAAILGEILAGASAIAGEAGIAIVVGHTIKSEEPIFGLAVVGTVHPQTCSGERRRPARRRADSHQALGLGIITTAAKNDQDSKSAIGDAIRVMTTLNRTAAEMLVRFEVHALTDVTGFGLLGHLQNVTAASVVTAEIWADRVPVLSAAREYLKAGIAPAARALTGSSSPTGWSTRPTFRRTNSYFSATRRPPAGCSRRCRKRSRGTWFARWQRWERRRAQ
jgi:selenide, water dikinase